MRLQSSEWVDHFKREYLSDFVPRGGATVKFAVLSSEEQRGGVIASLRRAGEEAGHLVASIDSARTKIHYIERLVLEANRQLDWGDIAARSIRAAAASVGIELPNDRGPWTAAEIAAFNGRSESAIYGSLDDAVERLFKRNTHLAREFGAAMYSLCRALIRGELDGGGHAVAEWLKGELKLLGDVKRFGLYGKIDRRLGREIVRSLGAHLQQVGVPGLLILVDALRLQVPKNPKDGLVFYTRSSLLDVFEVMREFIDGTDALRGLSVVFVLGDGFLDPEAGGRGLAIYPALRNRITDDVHDSRRANPFAALVRLADGPRTGGG